MSLTFTLRPPAGLVDKTRNDNDADRGCGSAASASAASTAFAFGGKEYKAEQARLKQHQQQSDQRPRPTSAAAPRKRNPAVVVSAAGKRGELLQRLAVSPGAGATAGAAGSAGSARSAGSASASRGPPSGAYRQSHAHVDEEPQPQPPRPSLAAALTAAAHRPASRREADDSDGDGDGDVDGGGDSGSGGGARVASGSLGRLSSPMTAARPTTAMIGARNLLAAMERDAAELSQRLEAQMQRVNALGASDSTGSGLLALRCWRGRNRSLAAADPTATARRAATKRASPSTTGRRALPAEDDVVAWCGSIKPSSGCLAWARDRAALRMLHGRPRGRLQRGALCRHRQCRSNCSCSRACRESPDRGVWTDPSTTLLSKGISSEPGRPPSAESFESR